MLHCVACDKPNNNLLHDLCPACEFVAKQLFTPMKDIRIACSAAVDKIWRTPLTPWEPLVIVKDALPDELKDKDFEDIEAEDIEWLSSLLNQSSLRTYLSGSQEDGKDVLSVTQPTTKNAVRQPELKKDGSSTVTGAEKPRYVH